jgi:spermidine/putrescine transport system substrate-binding protein
MAIVTKEKLDRLYEAYKNGTISRRQFLKYLGLAGATIGLVGSPFGNAVKEAWAAKSIRFDGWGGVVSEASGSMHLSLLPKPRVLRSSMANSVEWTPT